MKNYKLTLILAFIVGLSTSLQATTLDSLGLKKENNKTFLLFKVGPKQSLFSILKRYNLSLSEFKSRSSNSSATERLLCLCAGFARGMARTCGQNVRAALCKAW